VRDSSGGFIPSTLWNAPKEPEKPSGGSGGGGGGGGGGSGSRGPNISIPNAGGGSGNPVTPLSHQDLVDQANDIVRRGNDFIASLDNPDLLDFHADRLALMFDPGDLFQSIFGGNGAPPQGQLPEVLPSQTSPYYFQMLGDMWNPQNAPQANMGPGMQYQTPPVPTPYG